jgi:glutathionyl-hydroquinone reductase
MNENDFKTVDVGKTFINAYGQECSTIDFILFPKSIEERIVNLSPLTDIYSMTSDHYPVAVTVKIYFSNNKKCVDIQKDGIKALKPDWNKIDKVQYQQEIEEKLDNLPLNIDSPAHIDTCMAYYSDISCLGWLFANICLITLNII